MGFRSVGHYESRFAHQREAANAHEEIRWPRSEDGWDLLRYCFFRLSQCGCVLRESSKRFLFILFYILMTILLLFVI
jgi:hypothetical protein